MAAVEEAEEGRCCLRWGSGSIWNLREHHHHHRTHHRTPPSYLFLRCPRSETPLPPYSSVDHPLTIVATISTPPPYTVTHIHHYGFCEGCQLSISGSSTWINEKNTRIHTLATRLWIVHHRSTSVCIYVCSPLSHKYISWMSY